MCVNVYNNVKLYSNELNVPVWMIPYYHPLEIYLKNCCKLLILKMIHQNTPSTFLDIIYKNSTKTFVKLIK